MRTGLHKTYPFKADYYDFAVSQNTDSGAITQTQVFDHTFSCRVVTDGTGRLIIFTSDDLRVGGKIKNVRDRDDRILVPGATALGAVYTIDLVEPELNVFGSREDWVYACIREDD